MVDMALGGVRWAEESETWPSFHTELLGSPVASGTFAFSSCPFRGQFSSRSHLTWWFFGKLSPSLLNQSPTYTVRWCRGPLSSSE